MKILSFYQHCLVIQQLKGENTMEIFALNHSGTLIYPFYETLKAAQDEIETYDEDEQYLIKPVKLSSTEYFAIFTIQEFLSNSIDRQNVLDAINDPSMSDSRDFVLSQLSGLGDRHIHKQYFLYLMHHVYRIDLDGFSIAFEPLNNMYPCISYKQYAQYKAAEILTELYESNFNGVNELEYVGQGLFGDKWQSQLAASLTNKEGEPMPASTIRTMQRRNHNIPHWLLPQIKKLAQNRVAEVLTVYKHLNTN